VISKTSHIGTLPCPALAGAAEESLVEEIIEAREAAELNFNISRRSSDPIDQPPYSPNNWTNLLVPPFGAVFQSTL
jgi:hypothetical protein